LTRFAKTVEAHRHGVPHWFRTKISNGLLEGLSSLVQAPKARTRSFRLIRTLVAMTYLLHGKLSDLQPIQSSDEPLFGSAPP
jgi:transposase